jgi:hypothetical protein
MFKSELVPYYRLQSTLAKADEVLSVSPAGKNFFVVNYIKIMPPYVSKTKLHSMTPMQKLELANGKAMQAANKR